MTCKDGQSFLPSPPYRKIAVTIPLNIKSEAEVWGSYNQGSGMPSLQLGNPGVDILVQLMRTQDPKQTTD